MQPKKLNIATVQKNAGDYFGAKESLVEAITFLEKTSTTKFLASCYNELGTISKQLGNYNDALTYYQKAIELTTQDLDAITYQNNLALVFKETSDFKKAFLILNRIITNPKLDKESSIRPFAA